jgi:hypothetical protein
LTRDLDNAIIEFMLNTAFSTKQKGILVMKQLAAACIVFCLTVYTAHAAVGDRYTEQAGGFSFQVPKGWTFREHPSLQYKIIAGPTANAFTPTIVVVDGGHDGSLKSFVDATKNSLEKKFQQFKIIKRDAFVTASGVKGEKMITTVVKKDILFRQTYYFLPGKKGKFYSLTGSVLAAGGEAFDAVFDESIKTFELIK